MSNTMIVKLMSSLINRKYYPTKEEAISKLDVYFALGRISEEEYAELVLAAEAAYMEPAEELPEEEVTENTEPTE